MLTETELIVLGAVRYSDNASIVSTYSECFGALSFKCIRSASRRRGQANAFFYSSLNSKGKSRLSAQSWDSATERTSATSPTYPTIH